MQGRGTLAISRSLLDRRARTSMNSEKILAPLLVTKSKTEAIEVPNIVMVCTIQTSPKSHLSQ